MNRRAKDRHQRGWTEEEIEAEARELAEASLRALGARFEQWTGQQSGARQMR
jgi:hypothetical protein